MDANTIIDAFGGTSAVAGLCEVTTGAVSQWRSSGIPPARLMYLKILRPEVFAEEPPETSEPGLSERKWAKTDLPVMPVGTEKRVV